MKSLRTKFSVGLFVIIGMSVILLSVLWLGMSEYFREGKKYAAYFDESVQGLSRDAAVKYRGVSVGRVDQIGVAPDGRLVEIIFSLDKKLQHPRNLVAQIKSVGITGIRFVELERPQPEDRLSLPDFDFETKYQVIATKPSEIKQLISDVFDILSRIQQVDLQGLSSRLTAIMDNVNRILNESEIEKLSTGLQTLINRSNRLLDAEKWREFRSSINDTTQKIDGLISDTRQTVNSLDTEITTSANHFNAAVDEIYQAADRVDNVFASGSRTLESAQNRAKQYDRRMMRILEELESASADLNRLLEQLNRQPSRMIFGAPLPEKPVAPKGK
ncbi:MAG: MCE family protein [Desulfobacteraceae bacterium]|nr:MCE family protein [Desulfobacteraceae bacterium]